MFTRREFIARGCGLVLTVQRASVHSEISRKVSARVLKLLSACVCAGLFGWSGAAWTDDASVSAAPPVPPPTPVQPAAGAAGPAVGPAVAPVAQAVVTTAATHPSFVPVPEISVDPDGGATFGILPVWLQLDENHAIRRIIAPDLLYNQYFGWGMHARVYGYPSADEQWSLVAGIMQRVERGVDFEYQSQRQRQQLWSFNGSLIYDRNGTPRFYGIGNNAPAIAETDYTNQQEIVQGQIGLNITHAWQLQYTARFSNVDVLPGTLAKIASINQRFANILGEGTTRQMLNRISIGYDSRDDLTTPQHGMEWVLYTGLASRNGIFNDSMYSEVGIDGRNFWTFSEGTTVATHMSLRYLPTANQLPFWAFSSLGGDQSAIGGDQPLRGYGAGRYYGRNSVSGTIEVRQKAFSADIFNTHLDVELTPFLDVGRVFERTSQWPLTQLHKVAGLGFRGIARPFVVGYVDVGYGDDGVAVFTGINYPF